MAWKIYLALWVPLSAFFVLLLGSSHSVSWAAALEFALPLCLLYALLCMPAWYMCRALQPSSVPLHRLLLAHGTAAFLAAGLLTVAALLVPGGRLSGAGSLMFSAGVLMYVLTVAFDYLMLSLEAARETKDRLLRADVLAREAELRALKAQMNPHFLFNSLNSISALTASDPARAREMCVLLGDFLRRTLGLGEKPMVPLSEELALVHAFLAVEKVRFGERIRMDERVAEDTLDAMVPPLLMQPLVENAVVHGVAHLVDGGWIRLEAARKDGHLRLMVENAKDPDPPAHRGTGLGLANVRRRLRARFGNQAAMDIASEAERFRVTLTLPIENESA